MYITIVRMCIGDVGITYKEINKVNLIENAAKIINFLSIQLSMSSVQKSIKANKRENNVCNIRKIIITKYINKNTNN